VQNTNDAAVKDVQIKLVQEECAIGMEQRSNYAPLMDAQIIPNEEEYAGDTVQIAILTTNLLLSHRVWYQTLIKLP